MKSLFIQGDTKDKILRSMETFDKFRFSVASRLFGGNVVGLRVEGTPYGTFVTAVQSYAKPTTPGWLVLETNIYHPDFNSDEGKALLRSLSELQSDVLYDALLEVGVKISPMSSHSFIDETLVIHSHSVSWVTEKPDFVTDLSS